MNKKLPKLLEDAPQCDWETDFKWREANITWIRLSQNIALSILTLLTKNDMTKDELSEVSGFKTNTINVMVKGSYPFSIFEITKLGEILNFNFIELICEKHF